MKLIDRNILYQNNKVIKKYIKPTENDEEYLALISNSLAYPKYFGDDFKSLSKLSPSYATLLNLIKQGVVQKDLMQQAFIGLNVVPEVLLMQDLIKQVLRQQDLAEQNLIKQEVAPEDLVKQDAAPQVLVGQDLIKPPTDYSDKMFSVSSAQQSEIKQIASLLWEAYSPVSDNRKFLPSNFKIIASSNEIKNEINTFGLKALAATNQDNNQIYFAFAGTDLLEYKDLIDDLKVIAGMPQYKKFAAMKHFINHVAKQSGSLHNFLNSDIVFCGHSLGGIFAEAAVLVVNDLKIENNILKGQVKAVSFENPGSLQILTTLYQEGNFSKLSLDKFNQIAKHSYIYNNKQNFVNSWSRQFGENVYLQIIDENKLLQITAAEVKESAYKLVGSISYLTDFITLFPWINKIIECFNPYSGKAIEPVKKFYSYFLKVDEFFKDHSLDNFLKAEYGQFLAVEEFCGPNKQIILKKNILPFLETVTQNIQGGDNKKIAIISDDEEIKTLKIEDKEPYIKVDIYEMDYKDLIGIDINDYYEIY